MERRERVEMTVQPSIRSIDPTDVEAFRDAVGIVRAERKFLFPGPPSPIEMARSFVVNNLENGYPQLILDDNGKLAGWCDVVLERDNEATRHVGVLGIALLPEYRGRGLGERLLRATLSAAEASQFKRVQLGVFATNKPALSLYRKVGFVQEGTRSNYVKIDGVYIDEILMAIVR